MLKVGDAMKYCLYDRLMKSHILLRDEYNQILLLLGGEHNEIYILSCDEDNDILHYMII